MKIDCTNEGSHLNHILTASSTSVSADPEQTQYFLESFNTPAKGMLIAGGKTKIDFCFTFPGSGCICG